MSKRISMDYAKELYEKEMKLQEMQKQGIPLPKSSRRQKKYMAMRKRQDGILWKLKDRIRATGGRMPKHLLEKKER